MSVNYAATRYQSVQVGTCTPAKLVQLLLDGALRFASEAQAAMKAGDRARAGERIGRCHAIVAELLGSLDPSHAPELTENLTGLYGFCMQRLVAANISRDPTLLDEVSSVLTPLRDAWAELAAKG